MYSRPADLTRPVRATLPIHGGGMSVERHLFDETYLAFEVNKEMSRLMRALIMTFLAHHSGDQKSKKHKRDRCDDTGT